MHRVRRAIRNLEQLPDTDLFETLSEGMSLIVDNATDFEETARRLYQNGEFRASEVMRGFAKEEAAKVLILIDYVRCPNESGQRTQVLKRFYSHVAKRIYAMTCEYSRYASFGVVSDLVESECRPWYLDGPNDIDWIFPNSISAEREQNLYVDYVQDVTDDEGPCHWIAPAPPPICSLSQYQTSDCVTLVRSLFKVGALSTGGLAEIAGIWRSFKPLPDTGRRELYHLIGETLNRLAQCSSVIEKEEAQFIVSHWPFPLWPLTMKEPRLDDGDLGGLRAERSRTVEWIEETQAKRDPPPAISRAKVEDLSEVYATWQVEVEAREASTSRTDSSSLRIRPATDYDKYLKLTSYARIRDKLTALSDEEHVALVALAWFTRYQIADWPWTYAHAIKMTPYFDDVYQISLGSDWLAGLRRWESKPAPFSAGQLYRADRL